MGVKYVEETIYHLISNLIYVEYHSECGIV